MNSGPKNFKKRPRSNGSGNERTHDAEARGGIRPMEPALQVENHYFVNIRLDAGLIRSREELAKRNITSRPWLSVLQKPDDPTSWLAKLKLELTQARDGAKSLYTGVLMNAGEFRLSPEVPEEERHNYVMEHAGAFLYAAMRECIATLTARSLNGMIELPALDARSFIPSETKKTDAPTRIKASK